VKTGRAIVIGGSMLDAKGLLETIRPAAAEAGLLQLAHWRALHADATAGGASWAEEKVSKELVTFVDRESEALIAKALKDALPAASFYGEEGEKTRSALTWVVDPLDGTTNYVCGLDWFCVSIALFEGEGEASRPVLGLVHRPAADEWLWATRGGGAWESARGQAARRLPPAKETRLRHSLVCTGTPYRSPDTVSAFYEAAAEVTAAALDLRRMGSAALELCQVAAGRIQAFWEADLQPYDVGAALLLLEETGCPVSTFAGSRYDPFVSRGMVTGSPGAAQELREIVARRYAGILD
jgi:myo-inositol-1(or 4)-monophosphatase